MKNLIALLSLLLSLPALASYPAGSANQVLRVPSGGGPAKFGALDLSAAAATTNTLARSKVASGTANQVIINDGSGNLSGVSPGSSGNILQSTGSAWSSATISAPTIQRFTAAGTGTYTTPANVKWIRVTLAGGGGGGGGSGTTSTGGNGGNGGTSCFSSGAACTGTVYASAAGGTGGHKGNDSANGVGGAATTSAPLIVWQALTGGLGGTGNGGGAQFQNGGNGGSNPFGGFGSVSFGVGIDPIANTGAGGGGAGSSATAAASTGGGGGAGGFVDGIINSPAASYFYQVGNGGALGTAGTSGQNGAAGATGIVIVEEHYM